MKPITEELLARCRKGYEEDSHAQTLTAAAAKTEYADLASYKCCGLIRELSDI